MSDTEFHSSISHIFVDLAYDGTAETIEAAHVIVRAGDSHGLTPFEGR
jgi:hypothetical protein